VWPTWCVQREQGQHREHALSSSRRQTSWLRILACLPLLCFRLTRLWPQGPGEGPGAARNRDHTGQSQKMATWAYTPDLCSALLSKYLTFYALFVSDSP